MATKYELIGFGFDEQLDGRARRGPWVPVARIAVGKNSRYAAVPLTRRDVIRHLNEIAQILARMDREASNES